MFFALNKARLERLQKIQNRFLRLTFPTAKSSSIAIIHRIVDLETVKQRVWFNRLKLLNKFALSPTDHPLFQLRAQLYNQLVRPKKNAFTYSKQGPISKTIWDVAESKFYYGVASDFVWNLNCNLAITVEENKTKETAHPVYVDMVNTNHNRRALQLHSHQQVYKGNPHNSFLNKIDCENDNSFIIYGIHPGTALPNNTDVEINGFRYYRDDDREKPRNSTKDKTVIYTDGSMENMYSGAGVYIPKALSKKS